MLNAFLEREQQTESPLSEVHWQKHNRGQIDAMNQGSCREFEVDVFDGTGKRKSLPYLTKEIVNH